MSSQIFLNQFLWFKDKNLLAIYAKDIPPDVWSDVTWYRPFEVKSHVTGRIVVYIKTGRISGHEKNTWSKIICSPLNRFDHDLPEIHVFPGNAPNQ